MLGCHYEGRGLSDWVLPNGFIGRVELDERGGGGKEFDVIVLGLFEG